MRPMAGVTFKFDGLESIKLFMDLSVRITFIVVLCFRLSELQAQPILKCVTAKLSVPANGFSEGFSFLY